MPNYIEVNPNLLRWAVERSGLSVDDFKQPVREWIDGDSQPTFSMLESFAKRAMVPFGYLFLQKPPDEKIPVPDYRTRTDKGVARPSPNLLETLFEIQRRQQWMREYLLEQGHDPLPFVGSVRLGQNPVDVAIAIRSRLRIRDYWARGHGSTEQALRFLRKQVEAAGILIFINGVVGNATKRSLAPDEFQGFVLADEIAPTIFVNGADTKATQIFTISHELAHIWIGASALFNDIATDNSNERQEKYCNKVAAELLVPKKLFEELWEGWESEGDEASQKIAKYFKVSPVMVARRAKELGHISADVFLFSIIDTWRTSRTVQRRNRKAEASGITRTRDWAVGLVAPL